MWASSFTWKKYVSCCKKPTEISQDHAPTWWGLGEGFLGEQWGYVGAMCDWEVPPESLWPLECTAVELSCINRTEVPCVSGCDLLLLGQQGAVERELGMESEDSGMSLSPGARCLISLSHYFPNWKARRKLTHWMCLTGVLYGLNKKWRLKSVM